MKTIAIVGTFDSKGEEFLFLKKEIEKNNIRTITIDIGIKGPAFFTPDIQAKQVAAYAGKDIDELLNQKKPALCMEAEAEGIQILMKKLVAEHRIDGMIGMGGGQGSSVLRCAVSVLPVGMPKMIVSTMAMAGGKLFPGVNDTYLINSIVDFAGLNDILVSVIENAAGAICGMVRQEKQPKMCKGPKIAASMFGKTTPCVEQVRKILEQDGYEFYPFHANGMGGQAMEDMITTVFFDGVADITTVELLQDLIIPGTGCSQRVEAAGKIGIPQIVVPGAMDNINVFDGMKNQFPGRRFKKHNAEIWTMRSNVEENCKVGKILADKLNLAKGKTVLMLPLRGLSMISGDGMELNDREADEALFRTLKENVSDKIEIVEIDAHINDSKFAEALCKQIENIVPKNRE